MIKPLADRVVARVETPVTQTKSGLYLGEAKEKPVYAVVEAVGPDVKNLKKNDKILFKEYTATTIKLNDTEYLIIKAEDVLATI